jgi:hypothetical protein
VSWTSLTLEMKMIMISALDIDKTSIVIAIHSRYYLHKVSL